MSKNLLPCIDSSDSDEITELGLGEQYANKYNVWRNKEELQKYKDIKEEEEDDSESSESEEEIPKFDEEFFRAYSLVKGKDRRLYDKNFELFKNKEIAKKAKTVKQKPMYIKDYERHLVLDREGKFSDEDEQIASKVPIYDDKQVDLLKDFKEADKNSDTDDDDIVQFKSDMKAKEEDGEASYLKWLKGEEKDVPEDFKKDTSYLRNYWNDPELGGDEKFLRDYILYQQYLEKDDSDIPTCEEVTSGMLSDDEKMIEEQEKFEHKYNFRFEEPDEEFIKRYPRTIGDSLRKADNRRKQKRDEKVERKRREREQRQEELKRLKALKRKEIVEKFSKIKEVSGKEEINLNESDIESDFDPDKHDQKMGEMFNEDYYDVEEEQKPEFSYDEELDAENWNTWAREKIIDDEDENEMNPSDIGEKVDQNIKMANVREEFAKEMIEATLPKKKVRKKSLFAKVISQPKPVYNPDGKSFDEYLDEYYKLDYEDVVGDLPVRYKYRKVIPNDFGLTVEEILAADDRELNRWCSVKKTCQYRKEDEEMYDVQAYKKKSQNYSIKKKVFSSLYSSKDPDNDANDDSLPYESKDKNYLAEESNHFVSLTNQGVNMNEKSDTLHSNSDEVKEQELNRNSFGQSNEYKKKSKKRKLKEKLKTEKHTENLSADNRLHLSDAGRVKKKIKYLNGEPYNSLVNDDAVLSEEMNDVYKNSHEAEEKESNLDSLQNINSTFASESSRTLTRKKKKNRNKNVSNGLVLQMNEEMDATHSNSTLAEEEKSNKNSLQNIDSTFASESSPALTRKKKKNRNKNNAFDGAVLQMNEEMDVPHSNSCQTEEEESNQDFSVQNIDSTFASESSPALTRKKKKKNRNKNNAFDGAVLQMNEEMDVPHSNSCQTEEEESNQDFSVQNIDSRFIPECSEALARKKKNKKCSTNEEAYNYIGSNKSKVENMFKNKKHNKNVSGDKRLGLSNERLAAYGINPKKFKNRIIYSKK